MKNKDYPENKLRQLIRQSGKSIKDIAKGMNCIDKNVYYRIKHPEKFSIEDSISIAKVLNVEVIEIVRCVTKK